MLQILKRARVPPYLHRKSNHMYTVWQHLILLTLRQYESKSYRRFVEFLQESFGMMQYLGLSKIPHCITLQKAAARLTHGILIKMLESFVMYCRIRKIFAGIDSTGLSHGQASLLYKTPQTTKKICQYINTKSHMSFDWYNLETPAKAFIVMPELGTTVIDEQSGEMYHAE